MQQHIAVPPDSLVAITIRVDRVLLATRRYSALVERDPNCTYFTAVVWTAIAIRLHVVSHLVTGSRVHFLRDRSSDARQRADIARRTGVSTRSRCS